MLLKYQSPKSKFNKSYVCCICLNFAVNSIFLLDVDSGVCGSYSCCRASDAFFGTKPNSEPDTEDCENRPSKRSPLKSLGKLIKILTSSCIFCAFMNHHAILKICTEQDCFLFFASLAPTFLICASLKVIFSQWKCTAVITHFPTTTAVFVVAPKPAHLQRLQKTVQDQACNSSLGTVTPQQVKGTTKDLASNRECGICITCVSLQACQGSPSPVRGRESSFLNPLSGEHISPCRQTQQIPNLSSCLVSRSPSPAKRSIHGCSPLREKGHSPAKLSPRNHSPLMGKLRTPSPVQKKMGSFSPAKSSKSWLGLHRISSEKLERREKKAEKSISVPDLIVYMDETRYDFG